MSGYLLVVELLLGVACILFYISIRLKRLRLSLPPGPPEQFLLGNLKDIPKDRPWIQYARMSKECQSDIISLSALGTTIIVLNSHRSVTDLLEKRAIYADRPHIPMISDKKLMDLGDIIQFTRYGPRLRQLRKAIRIEMQESAIPNYWPSQVTEAQRLVARLADHGDKHLLEDIQHWAAASILSDTYGYKLSAESSNDPLLQIIEELVQSVAQGVSSARFLVNVFPIFKYVPEWIPGADFQVFARRGRVLKEQVLNTPFEWVKGEMAKGTARSSYVSGSLSRIEHKPQHDADDNKASDQVSYEEIVRSNAAAMFGAGYDTTVSTLRSFFIAMQLYPEVQARARQEVLSAVDSVTHVLDLGAVMKLSYLRQVLKELLRWLPALPLGLPHAVTEDDEYRGYRIPAGSIVIANHWAISRDESIYPNPEIFDPGRFSDPHTPHEVPFGHGRRRCPGMHLANSNMLITFAHLLLAFEFEKAVASDGALVEPSITLKKDDASSTRLRCRLQPRDMTQVRM